MNFKQLARLPFHSPRKTIADLRAILTRPIGRILFFRIDRLGDLLVSSPLIRAFKLAHPQWTIHLVGSPINEGAAYHMEFVDQVSIFNRLNPLPTLSELRVFRPDVAIDLNAAQSFTAGLLALLSGASCRAGYQGVNVGKFYHVAIPLAGDPETLHQLDMQRQMAGHLEIPWGEEGFDFRIPEGARLFARDFFATHFREGERVIAIHPGNIKKREHRWPVEKFIELANRLNRLQGHRILLIYGPMEVELMREMTQGISVAGGPPPLIPPPCTLPQTAGLIENSALYIDSGPTGTTHLATTLKTPQIIIYSRYSFQAWDTRKPQVRAVVADHWEDTRGVEVEAVFKSCTEALGIF